MNLKEIREILQHYYRRAITRFCTAPRTFDEVINHMTQKVDWSRDLAYVLVAEHLGYLEKSNAVKQIEDRWVITELAAKALKKYF